MLVAVPVIARDALLNALLRHLKIYADPAVFPAGRRKHPQFQGIQGGAGVPICRIGKKMKGILLQDCVKCPHSTLGIRRRPRQQNFDIFRRQRPEFKNNGS